MQYGIEKSYCIKENLCLCLQFRVLFNHKLKRTMKKMLMSMAVVAAMFAVASCACCNNSENAAEVAECCEACDSTKACCDSAACAACDSTACTEVAAE